MHFVIVTGMSGAGKSMALKFMEDIGYFCIDNLPPMLISKFAEICISVGGEIDKVALGIDVRGGKLFSDLFSAIEETREHFNFNVSILFLDATDDTLIKRYKETRRSHPLMKGTSIISGIAIERELLAEVKNYADYIIDTSQILTRQLKEQINKIFLEEKSFSNLMITILSFGHKHGLPNDADLVFDVRFMPNPFYMPELREKTGNDDDVRNYVLGNNNTSIFLDKCNDMIDFLIPNYIEEGKNQLVIAMGCTGGKHRSVSIANEIYKTLQKKGHSVIIKHRDITKDLGIV